MKDLGKINRINLLVLLAYSLLLLLISWSGKSGPGSYENLEFPIFMMVLIILQVVVNLILMIVKFVQGDKETGLSYLVSLFIVAIVGFSSCFGGIALLG